jgi:HK97 family phage major capsid protein
MVTTADVTNPPVDTGVFLTKVTGQSALTKLVPQVPLSGSGSIFHTFDLGAPALVGEGALKPMSSTALKSIELGAHKFTNKFTVTDEALEDVNGLENALYTKVPSLLVNDIDFRAIGDRVAPAENFTNLSAAPSMEVGSVEDFYEVLAAVGDNGVNADGILITSGFLLSLRGKRNASGFPVFDIDANLIEGVPYAVVNSPARIAYVGPFASRAVWGIVPEYPKVKIVDGAFTMPDGSVLTLADHNLKGVIAETRIGFRVADVAEFVKIVPATTP